MFASSVHSDPAVLSSMLAKPADPYANKTHTSHIAKGRDGWEAKSEVELDGERWLKVNTHKTHGGLVTYIQAVKVENGCYSFVLFQDFNESFQWKGLRCTEKTVTTQHLVVMDAIEKARTRALEFYAAKAAADMARVCPVPPMPALMTA